MGFLEKCKPGPRLIDILYCFFFGGRGVGRGSPEQKLFQISQSAMRRNAAGRIHQNDLFHDRFVRLYERKKHKLDRSEAEVLLIYFH